MNGPECPVCPRLLAPTSFLTAALMGLVSTESPGVNTQSTIASFRRYHTFAKDQPLSPAAAFAAALLEVSLSSPSPSSCPRILLGVCVCARERAGAFHHHSRRDHRPVPSVVQLQTRARADTARADARKAEALELFKVRP